jgi:hypothetical protein
LTLFLSKLTIQLIQQPLPQRRVAESGSRRIEVGRASDRSLPCSSAKWLSFLAFREGQELDRASYSGE